MKQWYEPMYENYGIKYDSEVFTQGTQGECNSIEQEINYDKSLKIIDIGCGTGRHTIELSKRGYKVTGIDLSESLLSRAKEKAASADLKIDFRKCDARTLPFINEFDVAIMLCGGAFPLMETDEMNYEILKNISRALKEHGKLIMTTMNGFFPLLHSVKDFHSDADDKEKTAYEGGVFDLMTFRDRSTITVVDDFGNKKELECNERYYIPSEMTWLLKSVGFKTIDIYGAKLGSLSRGDKLNTDDFQMLIIAEK